MIKTIYLAGGCYWGAEKYLSLIKGVTETEVGFANGNTVAPSYEQVKYENTGHAETVKTSYDDEICPLEALLTLFYKIIDPTSLDKQGEDEGHQYRTGIYYTNDEDRKICEKSLEKLQEKYEEKIQIECLPLENFYTAEEYHQKYLDKNPGGYCHVPFGLMSWVKDVEPLAIRNEELEIRN